MKHRDCLWGYGIMNEPHDLGAHTSRDTAQYAVNCIRSVDTRHPVILPGDGYSGASRWLTHGADLALVNDPADNVVFEAHQYFDADGTGLYQKTYDADGANPGVAVAHLSPFVQWCREHGVRGYLGEFGVPDTDPRWLTILQNAIDHLVPNRVAATYWAGGPWWGDYALSTEPRRAHDEAPQMAHLVPHGSGVGTRFWPAFTWHHDAFVVGPQGSYVHNYKSASATVASPGGATFAANAPRATHRHGQRPSRRNGRFRRVRRERPTGRLRPHRSLLRHRPPALPRSTPRDPHRLRPPRQPWPRHPRNPHRRLIPPRRPPASPTASKNVPFMYGKRKNRELLRLPRYCTSKCCLTPRYTSIGCRN